MSEGFLLQLTINDLPLSFMKRFTFYLLLFTFCTLLLAACKPAAAPVSISNKPVSINDIPTNVPMPPTKNVENMGWTKADGAHETLGAMKGKVIILDFWATYCPPCLEEIPHLVELQNKHGAQGLQIIGLHTGGVEDRPKVPAFVEKLKMNYVLAYPEDALADTLLQNDDRIPQTFVFDRTGKLVKGFVGFDAKIKEDLDKTIQATLKN